MRVTIDWASLITGNKSTIFALFYYIFEGNFPSTSPQGAYIWRGDLTEGFLRYRFGGLIFGGAYTLRGLFSEFYGIFQKVENGHLGIMLSFQCYEIFLHLTFGFMRMKDTILRILKISPLTNGHGTLLCICFQKHLTRNKSIVYSGHLLDNFAF